MPLNKSPVENKALVYLTHLGRKTSVLNEFGKCFTHFVKKLFLNCLTVRVRFEIWLKIFGSGHLRKLLSPGKGTMQRESSAKRLVTLSYDGGRMRVVLTTTHPTYNGP